MGTNCNLDGQSDQQLRSRDKFFEVENLKEVKGIHFKIGQTNKNKVFIIITHQYEKLDFSSQKNFHHLDGSSFDEVQKLVEAKENGFLVIRVQRDKIKVYNCCTEQSFTLEVPYCVDGSSDAHIQAMLAALSTKLSAVAWDNIWSFLNTQQKGSDFPALFSNKLIVSHTPLLYKDCLLDHDILFFDYSLDN